MQEPRSCRRKPGDKAMFSSALLNLVFKTPHEFATRQNVSSKRYTLTPSRYFRPETACLSLASCQRIAFSTCASTASGREKSIREDNFEPGAFLSFIS